MDGKIEYTAENKLSDIENTTWSGTAEYDGFIVARSGNLGGGSGMEAYINGKLLTLINGGHGANNWQQITVPLSKGDSWSIIGNRDFAYARWYKNRDYSNR